MGLQPDTDAVTKAISDIVDLISHYIDLCSDRTVATAIAAKWYALDFRADGDLPDWLAAGWLNPSVAYAAATVGLTPNQAVTAAEHALAHDYLNWWERDDNPHVAWMPGELGEAWGIYVDDKYPTLARNTHCAFCDRTAFAVKAACSGLLAVNFSAYASRSMHTQTT